MLQSGQVLPSDFFWQEGMAEWGVVSDKWELVSTPVPSQAQPTTPASPALSERPKTSAHATSSRSKDYPIAFVYSLVVGVALLALS
jgi:hypothetical protein